MRFILILFARWAHSALSKKDHTKNSCSGVLRAFLIAHLSSPRGFASPESLSQRWASPENPRSPHGSGAIKSSLMCFHSGFAPSHLPLDREWPVRPGFVSSPIFSNHVETFDVLDCVRVPRAGSHPTDASKTVRTMASVGCVDHLQSNLRQQKRGTNY